MRGQCNPQLSMLAFVDLDARIPPDHPLRTVKRFADRAIAELSPIVDQMCAAGGRPTIPPERLLTANLLIALFFIRSERAFCEELSTTSCTASSSKWTCSSPASTPAPSSRTAGGCSGMRRPSSSSTRWCSRPTGWGCSGTRTSGWTAR